MFTIFTKVKFVFFPPKGVESKPVVTLVKGFTEVPNWVKADALFKLGVQAGEISVMSSKEKVLRTEAALANNEEPIPPPVEPSDDAETPKPAAKKIVKKPAK